MLPLLTKANRNIFGSLWIKIVNLFRKRGVKSFLGVVRNENRTTGESRQIT